MTRRMVGRGRATRAPTCSATAPAAWSPATAAPAPGSRSSTRGRSSRPARSTTWRSRSTPGPSAATRPTTLLELARDVGCLFSIDSDAHAPGQLDFLVYGCERAEQAGHRPRPDRQHLAAGPPPGLGEPVVLLPMPRQPRGGGTPLEAAPPYRLGVPRRRPDRRDDPGLADPRGGGRVGRDDGRPPGAVREAARGPPTRRCCSGRTELNDRYLGGLATPGSGALGREPEVALGLVHAR